MLSFFLCFNLNKLEILNRMHLIFRDINKLAYLFKNCTKTSPHCGQLLWLFINGITLFGGLQFGYIVLTTSAGIMDHEEARRKNVGGKVLGFFY